MRDAVSLSVEKMNSFYAKGQLDQLEQYLEEFKDSHFSDYLYNKGLVEYKRGDFFKARVYWEQAKSNGFLDPSLMHNLKVVRTQLGFEGKEDFGLQSQIPYYLKGNFAWFFISIICLFSSLSFFLKKKKVGIYALTVTLALAVMNIFFLEEGKYALIQRDASLREGPSRIFEEGSKLPYGLKVKLEKEKNDWYFIVKPVDYIGWVYKDNLVFIGAKK